MTAAKKISRGPRAQRAFSFVELLIAIIVVAILGSTVVSALWTIFGMISQTSDYMEGRKEIEFIAQAIGREISNVGLAMPNNRKEEGSFAASFHGETSSPIMAIMGKNGEAWGGPITLGSRNPTNVYTVNFMVKTLTTAGGRSFYQGPELYYAWSVPTEIKVRYPDAVNGGKIKERGSTLALEILESTGLSVLRDFKYGFRNIGIAENDARNPSSWILLPTSRIPLLIERAETGGEKDRLIVKVAPGSPITMSGPFTGLDEVCLPQVARLYRSEEGELVQLVFGSDYENNSTTTRNVLAHNIAGLHFTYDPQLRLLSMYIAARGEEGNLHNVVSTDVWPSFAGELPRDRRLVVNRIDWRIRN
jgi:prepilin-type N-terminal cleavage/methylation domain-containing protein